MSPVPSSDEQPLDRLVDRAPLVLVRLVAAQEVEPADAGGEGARDQAVDQQDRPATGRGRPGRRRRCSRGSPRRSRSGCPAAIRRPPTDRNARRSGPSGPWSSNRRRKKTRLWAPPGVSGKRPSAPHFFWCRSMKASRSASGSVGVVEADLADGLGPADLAPDLVAVLLAERREVGVHVGPDRERDHRADVLALDVERPALGHLARPEGGGQGVRGRVAAAQPTEVDDVPRAPFRGFGEVAGQRVGDGRQVGGRRQDRGVVGVVRGAEEDRGRGRWDRRQVGRRRRGASSSGAGASSGSTSWRCINGTIATGSAPGPASDRTTTSVSSWALAR